MLAALVGLVIGLLILYISWKHVSAEDREIRMLGAGLGVACIAVCLVAFLIAAAPPIAMAPPPPPIDSIDELVQVADSKLGPNMTLELKLVPRPVSDMHNLFVSAPEHGSVVEPAVEHFHHFHTGAEVPVL